MHWHIWTWPCVFSLIITISLSNRSEGDRSRNGIFDRCWNTTNSRKRRNRGYITKFTDRQRLITNTWQIMTKTKKLRFSCFWMWKICVDGWWHKVAYGCFQFSLYEIHKLYSDLPFLPETMKIEKCHKPV